jgi:hypothetical protein
MGDIYTMLQDNIQNHDESLPLEVPRDDRDPELESRLCLVDIFSDLSLAASEIGD